MYEGCKLGPLPPIELQEVMRNPSITDEKIER